jgi:hypothetical protein
MAVKIGRSRDNKGPEGQIVGSMCNWEPADEKSIASFGIMVNRRHDNKALGLALKDHFTMLGKQLDGQPVKYDLMPEIGEGAGYHEEMKQLTVFVEGHWFIFTLFIKDEAKHKAIITELAKEVVGR